MAACLKRIRRGGLALATVWMAAASCAACGGAAAGAGNRAAAVMDVGYPAAASNFLPLYVGVAKGMFERNGLDVKPKLLSGSSSETSALESGGVQFDLIDANSALAAMAKGIKVVLVGNGINGYPEELWAKPSITSVPALAGKRLGLLHVNSLSDSDARENLPKLGLNLKTVKISYLGAPTTAVAALIAGKVDAVVAGAPAMFEAKAKGFRMLVNFARFHHVANGFMVSRSFLARHPAEVTDFLKGYMQSVAYIQDPAHKAAVGSVLDRYTRITDPTLSAETYAYTLPLLQCEPVISAGDLADSVQWLATRDHLKVDPNTAIDTAPLQALVKDGFVKKTCGG